MTGDEKMNRIWTIVVLSIVLQATAFAVPEYINYQARIFDATGAPMQGTYAISFAIFDASREGNMVWGLFSCDGLVGEGHADAVVVWDGWFNVILGPRDAAGRSLLPAFESQNGKPRFVEIQVQGETISPRQQLLAAPYAMEGYHSAYATNSIYALHGVPPGCILAYCGTVAPAGWLICDGSPIPAGEQYDALRALVGQNTPDLRGRMILGLDGSADRVRQAEADVIGAAAGEDYHQLTVPELATHNHAAGEYKYLLRVTGYSTLRYSDSTAGEPDLYNKGEIQSQGGDQPHNNMPPYMTLDWIIKY